MTNAQQLLARQVPAAGRLVDRWLRPAKGGLRNAREATVSLRRLVADRLTLTADLDVEAEEPGALSAMSRDDCYDVLRAGTVARYAYIARPGVPDIAPVNYALDGEDVLIRSGPGPKLQAAERHELVALETDVIDEDAHSGRSVVVIGRAERLSFAAERDLEGRIGLEPWAAGPRTHFIRVRPTRVTGRRVS